MLHWQTALKPGLVLGETAGRPGGVAIAGFWARASANLRGRQPCGRLLASR